jgi:hypothetical protein
MERWQHALSQNDKDFKELIGVNKAVFLQMHALLTADYHKRHKKGGRRPALSPGDQLLLTLQYWREYRTMRHLAYDFGIGKSTVSETITRVENVLVKDSRIPHKKSKNHPLSEEQRSFNIDLSRERIVIENINARIKTFKMMSERYRNRRKRVVS